MRSIAPRKGVLSALWIPLDSRGRLMKRALAAHIRWLNRGFGSLFVGAGVLLATFRRH